MNHKQKQYYKHIAKLNASLASICDKAVEVNKISGSTRIVVSPLTFSFIITLAHDFVIHDTYDIAAKYILGDVQYTCDGICLPFKSVDGKNPLVVISCKVSEEANFLEILTNAHNH